MGGDYTRFTFDPVKGFSGVRKQQGRVSLDSDWNELEDIVDRHARSEMYDTVGQAVVPRTTPTGFEIGVAGGHLTIGVGRAYVDGIQVECFGDTSDPYKNVRDDMLGGVRGPGPLDYAKQPFAYASGYPALSGTAGDINLVYLDVWQREVTAWEDDSLREPALNGPDTDTRVQTAWQVKVMKGATSASCTEPPAAWTDLTAPSTGRLSAKADGVLAPPPGPCVVNPAGGYTGLENRLYRVEVHRTGTLGGANPAEFKWSRDNASLVARVVSIVAAPGGESIITVSSTGRDAWMRFEHGDHLELLDDEVELAMRGRGEGGKLAIVKTVNHATGEIGIDRDLSGFAVDKARHPRVRRWDILTAAEPLTRPAVAGATNRLENGIWVTFEGAATDLLQAGDYWVFAARTADGSIDTVVNAPPRGILHHYARLALVRSGRRPVRISDCRIFWPPPSTGGHGESCCTVVVKPGESIQSAIDSLTGVGGCVCLKMGVHVIEEPLTIRQSNITLHAEAPQTIVRRTNTGSEMLIIGEDEPLVNVSVMGIHFDAARRTRDARMILVQNVTGGRIANCRLSIAGVDTTGMMVSGIALETCQDYALESNLLERFDGGIFGKGGGRVRVLGNTLNGPTIDDDTGLSRGVVGIAFVDPVSVDVERNVVLDYVRGIQLGEFTKPRTPEESNPLPVEPACRIAANVVKRRLSGAADVSPIERESSLTNVRGTTGASPVATGAPFAIAAQFGRCEIVENAVSIEVAGDVGIFVQCVDVLVARNLIRSAVTSFEGQARRVPVGVLAIVGETGLACAARENLFTGLQQAVFAAGTPGTTDVVPRLDVCENTIVGPFDPLTELLALVQGGKGVSGLLAKIPELAAILVEGVRHVRVAENEISNAVCGVLGILSTDLVVTGNHITKSAAGVLTLGTANGSLHGNRVRDTVIGIMDLAGTSTRLEANHVSGGQTGIDVILATDVDVRGNVVEDASLIGILVFATVHDFTLAHNRVVRCGYHPASPGIPAFGILALSGDGTMVVESCHVMDTGEKPGGGGGFNGPRAGIVVFAGAHARVHGCVVTSPLVAEANKNSVGLSVWVSGQADSKQGGDADVADNLVEQTASTIVLVLARSDVIFSSNRCQHLHPGGANGPVVTLWSTGLVVTGNRVRAQVAAPVTSLLLIASGAITAMANMTSGGATTLGATLVPAPYPTYNSNA
jgi:uncharacterized protein DUF6519/parallel beta helix pectate lyase-like protein